MPYNRTTGQFPFSVVNQKIKTNLLAFFRQTKSMQRAKQISTLLSRFQKRGLQSPYKPGQSMGFIDIMQGTYEDPKYALYAGFCVAFLIIFVVNSNHWNGETNSMCLGYLLVPPWLLVPCCSLLVSVGFH